MEVKVATVDEPSGGTMTEVNHNYKLSGALQRTKYKQTRI